ncbi:DNA mismatch repair endonuclease MutL [Candidatus Hoaglandella endobia]|uniref:DNA mismatch repair protein MutL n=1 Tax=Candidatus Hoaglandella endobia TaxID=1778263 RepID=A0A143WUE6_9ENTR|nr:DNA mismatch repair endonuclease MutL [Candidatus Hoaglandella endobia]CUX97383.1 DNA mismatch repair protein MutL [Candidatus Hoaglandella endobia]
MPIQVLPPQLVNQIAAGEVVARPASVVKELVENSLDAGATNIKIDIERGGSKRISIRDNGSGIHKNELVLALARHTTSKIASLEDFERITSMGFRGEALASVSSVSRLMLTSRTVIQNEAWQAYTEGYNLSIALKPTAHPVGTTVDVLDLFYNMPARRKFMRTEKTEFTHIDEVVRRIALARFDVTFSLQHNGKIVRQYRAVDQQSQQHLRRLSSLCGQAFVDCALAVSEQQGDLAIRGWIADPTGIERPEMQYSYVNLRMIRNNLINHAIRQAYDQYQLTGAQQPAFVLFLDVDAHQVDVNVHPTKHEVRFHQARLVHDFIYRAILPILQQTYSLKLPLNKENLMSGQHAAKKLQASVNNNYFRALRASIHQPVAVRKIVDLSPMHDAMSGHAVLLTKNIPRQAPNEGGVDNLQLEIVSAKRGKKELPRYKSSSAEPSCAYDRKNYQRKNKKNKKDVEHTAGAAHNLSCTRSTISTTPMTAVNLHSFGQVLTLVSPHYGLLKSGKNLMLLSLPVAERCLLEHKLTPDREPLRAQPLLIPLHMTLREEEAVALSNYQSLLQDMGLTVQGYLKQITVNSVPLPLRKQNLQSLIPDLLGYLYSKALVTHNEVAAWLSRRLQLETIVWSHSRAIQLLADMERLCPHLIQNPPDKLLVTLDLKAAIKALNHD